MAIATAHRHSALRDLGLLLARITLGVVFIAHGWQKVHDIGAVGVAAGFRGMGVPQPGIAAPLVSWLELIGGGLLILGAFTPFVGVLLAIDMLVAGLLVHASHGVFADKGGWELVGALGAAALALAAAGAGRFALDHLAVGRRAGRREGRGAGVRRDRRGSSAA